MKNLTNFIKYEIGSFGIILGIAALAVFASFYWQISSKAHAYALDRARGWAVGIPGQTGVSCNSYDSDGDGYISCVIYRSSEAPLQIECGLGGCRYPKLTIPQR